MYVKLILFLFVSFWLSACSTKINVDTIKSQEINLSKMHQKIFIEVKNSTKEKIHLEYDLKKALEQKGFIVVKSKEEASLFLKLNIVYAGIIDKKSGVTDVMKDINVNIGLGGSSGNVRIYTTIGSTIGRILGEKMDSTLFQTVVDIHIIEAQQKDKNTQFIITAPMQTYEKAKIIYHVEEEIVKRTLEIF